MIFLLLNILFSSSFILAIRWIQQRKGDVLTVGAINYIIAGAFAAVVFFGTENASYSVASITTGAVNGGGYFVAFFFLIFALTWKGAALTAVISRLSILLPVASGILIWHERPSVWQSIGIGLACLSLTLVGTRGAFVGGRNAPWYAPLVSLLLFITAGASRVAQAAFKHEANPAEQQAYLLAGFGLAGAVSIVMMVARGKRPTLSELTVGIGVGLANVLQTWFLLKALESFDGFLVFPVSSAGGLLLTSVIAVLLLKERLTRLSYAGVGLAVLSLALLHRTTS